MKCQNCEQKEANFFQHVNINGKVTETSLCLDCAKEQERTRGFSSPVPEMLSGFFGSDNENRIFPPVFPLPGFGFTRSPQVEEKSSEMEAPAATTIEEKLDPEILKKREINMLREQIKKAAKAEDFEKAMELQNKIKELESM